MKNKLLLTLIFVFSILFQSRHLFTPAFTAYDWRQWDTFAVIRNFRYEGMNIVNPRTNQIYVDEPKLDERLFLLDFPIYTYLSALTSFIVGLSPLAPRIINLISVGIISLILFKTIKGLKFDTPTALVSIALLNISPLFQFSASSIQPDMLMLVFFNYLIYLFLIKKKLNYLGLISLSLATLIKPYTFLIFLPILVHNYLKSRHDKKIFAYLFIPPILYVSWLARGFFSASGSHWYVAQSWVITFVNSWNFNLAEITLKLFAKIAITIITLPILFLAILGLKKVNKDINQTLILLFIGSLINILIFIPGNYNHVYYQLPILFPVYLLAGIGLTKLNLKNDFLKISALILFGVYLYIFPSNKLYKELLGQHHIYQKLNGWQFSQNVIPKGKSVVYFNDEGSPVLLNMMGRNGWVYRINGESCESQIQKIKKLKPDYALIFNSYINPSNVETQSNDRDLITCLGEESSIYKDSFITVFKITIF